MTKAQVALVELGASHDECMHFQINALYEAKIPFVIIAHQAVLNRNLHWNSFAVACIPLTVNGSAIGDVMKMFHLKKLLKQFQVDRVVFNTAQGGNIRNLAWILPRSLKCFGLIHTIRKFYDSKTQRVIDRFIRGYAVLGDDLKQRIPTNDFPKQTSLYALELPPVEAIDLVKPANEVWLAITGGVENRRKDLSGLFQLMEQAPQSKWIFLGKTNRELTDVQAFLAELSKRGLEDRVVLFEEFVSNEVFYAYLKQSDFLIPLIHPETESAKEYISNQISGAFSLSFSLGIPLLMHELYQTERDLRLASFFYSLTTFNQSLQLAIAERASKIELILNEPKWNIHEQRQRFLTWIELNK